MGDRVVQEALSNAARHARGAAVRVCVEWSPGMVHLQVEDGVGVGGSTTGGDGTGRPGMHLVDVTLLTGAVRAAVVSVLVADDQDIVRDGPAALLAAVPGIRVLDTAADGRKAVDRARQLRALGTPVDVVVMDIRMPVLDGITATRDLLAAPISAPPECSS